MPVTKGKKALKKTGRALKGAARGLLAAGSQILGAGAEALNPRGQHLPGLPKKAQREYEHVLKTEKAMGRSTKRAKAIAAGKVRKDYGRNSVEGIKKWESAWAAYVRALADLDKPASGARGKLKYARLAKAEKALQKLDPDFYRRVIAGRRNPQKGRTVVRTCNPKRKGAKKAGPIVKARAARAKKTRRRNLGHKDSDHPVEVTHHFRAGPPGYLTPWQRAHHAGQKQLFETGIKPAKKRNASKVSARHAQVVKRLKVLEGRIEKGEIKSISFAVLEKAAIESGKLGMRWLHNRADKEIQRRLRAGERNPTKRRPSNKTEYKRRAQIWKQEGMSHAQIVSKLVGLGFTRAEAESMAKGRRNPTATEIRKDFAGRVGAGRDLYFPIGTPSGQLAKLGKLVLIRTEAGDITPASGVAWLCSDTRGKLHVGSVKPAPLFDGPARNLGKMRMIGYEETKPHLGYPNPTIWFHKAGEETGQRPTLHVDKQGGLHIRGGAYRITRRGIEN